ncbi:MAG TPA: glycoside hydrolase family 15 protein [Candidatus Dormibacteraeota bacterium]|nr:glycoside hydrolase family 15 protein [Candidatus Dormibacteraeota bacterium]
MGRPVVLSNGQLFVGLDESGLVHDFYYPYVGLENLTNARSIQHKIGVWVDGQFSWTDSGDWEVRVDFEVDALVSDIWMRSAKLGISLHLQDFIDSIHNALIRHITITNDLENERDVRLFMHQVFQISRAGRADTALYVPDDHYILDYKGRYCLLIAGKFGGDNVAFDQYAVGNYAIEGKAGTFTDAEDGELSGNAVEHGGVDSVLRFRKHIRGGQSEVVDYWIVAASSQSDAQLIHNDYKHKNMEDRLRATRQYWQLWLGNGKSVGDFHTRSVQHSLLIIKAHCDERGSVLASGDSSIFNYGRDYYCYCWPRDAMYALWPLVRLGHYKEAKTFLDFARDTMHKDGYLMHKYQPDRAIGSTWHPLVHGRNKELAIQEDETASAVYLIGAYFDASKDKIFVENLYHSFVVPCANFMSRFIDEATGLPHASYDLWEEKFLTSTYTVCTVIAALETASRLADAVDQPDDAIRWKQSAASIRSGLDVLCRDGAFIKGFLLTESGELQYDLTADISNLYGPYMFADLKIDDPRIAATAKQVEERLANKTPSGGVLRHENDGYFLTKPQYQGNPWIVSTLWLAQYYEASGQSDKARGLLDWSVAHELPSGALSEQFEPETGTPLGVTPLVWSHAEMVNTILDLHKPAV